MNDLAGRLERTYKQLRFSTINYHLAAKIAKASKRTLELMKVNALASGQIQGKNANERDAKAREVFPQQYQWVEEDEVREAREKLNLALAQLEVDHARALIRIEEIKIGRLPNAGH